LQAGYEEPQETGVGVGVTHVQISSPIESIPSVQVPPDAQVPGAQFGIKLLSHGIGVAVVVLSESEPTHNPPIQTPVAHFVPSVTFLFLQHKRSTEDSPRV